jgi:hypothetical protein
VGFNAPVRCGVIAFIEGADVIRKILEHVVLWGMRRKPIPKTNPPPLLRVIEKVEGYVPTPHDDNVDPTYPVDASLSRRFWGFRRRSPENGHFMVMIGFLY